MLILSEQVLLIVRYLHEQYQCLCGYVPLVTGKRYTNALRNSWLKRHTSVTATNVLIVHSEDNRNINYS